MTKISVNDLKMSYLNQPNVIQQRNGGEIMMPREQSLQFLDDLERYEIGITNVTEWTYFPKSGTYSENYNCLDLSPEEMNFRESIQKAKDYIEECMKYPFAKLSKVYEDFITLFSIYTLDD